MGSAISGIVGGAMSMAQGSPSTPTENLSGQIANANDTYKTATADSTQTMNTAQALNAQSQGTLANTINANTNAASGVMDEANQNMSTYGSSFTPLQQQQASQAANYTSDSNIKQLQGQAVANQGQATQAALANQRASLASEGVDPASVHGSALTNQTAIQGAANAAGAASNAYTQAQVTGAGLMNQANQVGLQVGQQGSQGAATAAGINTSNVENTNNTNNSNVNNLTAANSYLNTATGANNSSVNAANSQFNAQQTGYEDTVAANAAQSQAVGGMAGGIASLAGGLMMGGPVPGAIPHLRGGGPITARGALPTPIIPGTTDTKLIAATPGEFMIPKDVTQHLGHEKLHKLIDKTREEIAQRQGIPGRGQLSSAHTSQGA
jgi:hypothetical protein